MILPPTIVIAAAPLPDHPPNGVLRDLLWNRSGSTFQSSVEVEHGDVGRASRGAACRPARPSRAPVRTTADRPAAARSIRPGRTSRSRQSPTAVSRPTIPNGATANGTRFSSTWCGAWSVAMTSTEPSASPASSASRSRSERSGGFILVLVESPLFATSSSVRKRWCGVTSQVTSSPRRLPSRISSRLRADEVCCR